MQGKIKSCINLFKIKIYINFENKKGKILTYIIVIANNKISHQYK